MTHLHLVNMQKRNGSRKLDDTIPALIELRKDRLVHQQRIGIFHKRHPGEGIFLRNSLST